MPWRAAAARLMAYPVIAYLTAAAFLYLRQDQILFPAPTEFARVTPSISQRFEDLRIPVGATGFLHAWWIPAAQASGKALLVLHGSDYVLEDMAGNEAANLYDLGVNLLLMDYRGYGSSTPIRPNEKTVDEDAQAALAYLLQGRRIPRRDVFLMGRSIGSGPATYLAQKTAGLGGLILSNPFSSVDDVCASSWYLRIFPAHLMLQTHFDNLDRISSVRTPLLILAGSEDRLVPLWMARKIYARANQPKQLYVVPGSGHDSLALGGFQLTEVLRGFLKVSAL